MTHEPHWTIGSPNHGLVVVDLSSWAYFDDFVTQEMLDYRYFIWRGQASADWPLESTLDRLLRQQGKLHDLNARPTHLRRVQLSTRGRRGANPAPLLRENDWWALGQHFGLATPLLDWTTSPYVAAYLAFYPDEIEGAERRAIYSLPKDVLGEHCINLEEQWRFSRKEGSPPIIEFVEPQTDENGRLVNQSGLFTRAPDGMTLEEWVEANSSGDAWVVKMTVPNRDRHLALRSLNRMNINHLSLFPDLEGASEFANIDLMIDRY